MLRSLLLVLVACGALPGSGGVTERVPCSTDCPSGTAVASFTSEELAVSDGFVVLDAECETVCAPIAPCVWPNVPIVVAGADGAEFSCSPLDNFSDLPSPTEVDLSWAELGPLADPVEVQSGLGAVPDWLAVADLDGDGLDDGIVGASTSVVSLLSDGAGGFVAGPAQDLADPVHQVAAGQFDDDAYADLVVRTTGLDGQQRLRLFTGLGDGSFAIGADLVDLGTLARGPEVADLDGDGFLDVAAQGPTAGGVFVLWGDGLGGFSAPQVLTGSCGLCNASFRLMRTTPSGRLDVLHEQSSWINDGGRAFTEDSGQVLPPLVVPDARVAAAVDVDGDDLDDVVFAGFGEVSVALAPDFDHQMFGNPCGYGDLLVVRGDSGALLGHPDCQGVFYVTGTSQGVRMVEFPESQGAPLMGDFGAVGVLP